MSSGPPECPPAASARASRRRISAPVAGSAGGKPRGRGRASWEFFRLAGRSRRHTRSGRSRASGREAQYTDRRRPRKTDPLRGTCPRRPCPLRLSRELSRNRRLGTGHEFLRSRRFLAVRQETAGTKWLRTCFGEPSIPICGTSATYRMRAREHTMELGSHFAERAPLAQGRKRLR